MNTKSVDERDNHLLIKENCLQLTAIVDPTKNLMTMVNTLNTKTKNSTKLL
eukprot:GAHX01001614.1.p5 GENE.GAHX01001614.1~~GAHX01001614.1.p5  ORF type:complete len:51 (-),score=13.77 GAHX01001614.1:1409-1561(-)